MKRLIPAANVFLAVLAAARFAWAVTITPPDCSQANVQTAINGAADGDTVSIPPGTCIWTTPGTFQPAVRIVGKGITLEGAGIDQTIITDSTNSGYNEVGLLIDNALGQTTRVTGLTFNTNRDQHLKGNIQISGGTHTFRIAHSKFNGFTFSGNAIFITGDTFGVIDHCLFLRGASGAFKAVQVSGADDTSWGQPLSLGTANAVYIEDNTFTYSPASGSDSYRVLDTARGGRVVFRYNVLNNTGDVGSHGYDSDPRAMISMEIYNNVFNHTVPGDFYTAISFRGGTGVVFNNRFNLVSGGWNSFISLYYYCSCPYNCSHPTQNVYPGKDQPGYAPDGAGGQMSAPIYEWNNTINLASRIGTAGTCAAESAMVQPNRDYFSGTARPDYAPYAYPHPLVSGGPPSDLPPAAPKNLRWQ